MTSFRAVVLLLVVATAFGCGDDALPSINDFAPAKPDSSLLSLLGDYQARFLVEEGGIMRLFILGGDSSKVAVIEKQEIEGHAQGVDDVEAIPIRLEPDPQKGDPPNKTSRFKGTVPDSLRGKAIMAAVMIEVKGERYRASFRTPRLSEVIPPEHSHEQWMPRGAAAEVQEQLYLTPAGKYTPEDIQANGNVTASQKYRGVMAAHDLKPKPGDMLCPITDTKANPKFTWIIGGQTYEFCCPPCIDEFLLTAKEKPDQIKSPAEYVKK